MYMWYLTIWLITHKGGNLKILRQECNLASKKQRYPMTSWVRLVSHGLSIPPLIVATSWHLHCKWDLVHQLVLAFVKSLLYASPAIRQDPWCLQCVFHLVAHVVDGSSYKPGSSWLITRQHIGVASLSWSITLGIIVVSIVCSVPGIRNEGLWTPCSEGRRSVTEIKDDSRWPFTSISGLPCIGVVGGESSEDGTKPRRSKMV